MQHPQPTDAPRPAHATLAPSPTRSDFADLRQIDEAVDYAARVSKAAVSEFLASPARPDKSPSPAVIELAVEFFVPPGDADAFARELDRALTRRSPAYAAARRAGGVGPMRVTVIPPGAFHQWRSAWNVSPRAQHDHRWSADRQLLDGLLRQALVGWREPAPLA
jgi:hypothetical protein